MSDLIDRQATLTHIEKIRQSALMLDDTHRASIIMTGMYLCEKAVRNQPSALPERKRGKWIRHLGFSCPWECSECNTFQRDVSWYCPHCGVQMEVQDE